MKKNLSILLGLILAGCTTTIPLPNEEIDHEIVCGKDPCTPGNGVAGNLLSFTKDPISPDITDDTSPHNVAMQIVGKTQKRGDTRGKDPITCSAKGPSPFGIKEIVPKSGSSNKFKYEKSEKLTIDVNLAVQADLKAIKAIAPTIDLSDIEVKLTTAYSSIDNRTVIINGYYREYGLSSSVIDNITRGVEFEECKTFIKTHDRGIVTDIGLLYFDIKVNGNSMQDIGKEVQTMLNQKGIIFNIGASIRHEATSNLKSIVEQGFQVVGWRVYYIEELEL